MVLCHYQIIVHPEIKGRKLAQVIKIALSSEVLGALKPNIVTDFSAIMLSVLGIPQASQKFKIRYRSEDETQASQNAKEYTISLDPIGYVNLSDSAAYLQQSETNSSGLPVEQALDIILGHHRKLSNNIAIVNKRKAFLLGSGAEERGIDSTQTFLVALRGYFSSVRMSQSSLLVNINVCHGAFYKAPKNLTEVIAWLENTQRVDPSKVPGLLRGLRVHSSHIKRVWTLWGYPRSGDGRGYMLHPPRFGRNTTRYTPADIEFFHEEEKDPSKGRDQNLNEKDKENAKTGKLKSHDSPCSCSGRWLSVAEYFQKSIMTFCRWIKCVLTGR